MNDERPLADPSRVEAALHLFPFQRMSPGEYAARWSHTIGCSSFGLYRYPDPMLGAWIDELHRLFGSPEEIERWRRTYLTAEEYEAVQAEIVVSREHGL